jgi:hypothetical protein
MKKQYSHIPFPTVRLNAKGKIIQPALKVVKPPPQPFVESRELNLAVKAPFAPIQMLTVEQKIQMEQPILIPSTESEDMEAFYTSVNVAEFVLE